MKTKPNFTGLKPLKFEEFLKALESKEFNIKIRVWTSILVRLKEINKKFQGQSLEIQNLKMEINGSISELANLFIDPKHIPQGITEFKADEWVT